MGGRSTSARSRKCKVHLSTIRYLYISTIEEIQVNIVTYRCIATSEVLIVKTLTSELWWLHVSDGELETLKLENKNLTSFSLYTFSVNVQNS